MEWTEVAEDLLDRTGIATHPGSDDINGWVRNAPGDRLLSDAEWTEVVEDLMDRTGIRGRDDRWLLWGGRRPRRRPHPHRYPHGRGAGLGGQPQPGAPAQ